MQKKGDLIFDPMIGSQSSRIAAYKLEIDFVGCEINQQYFMDGNERFSKECQNMVKHGGSKITQLTLF